MERFPGKTINLKYLPVHDRTGRTEHMGKKKKNEDTENYASKKKMINMGGQMFTQESKYNLLIESPVNISMNLVL